MFNKPPYENTKHGQDISTEGRARETLSEGRLELQEALGYMNSIKEKVASWHGNKKEFFEEVANEYETKARKIDKREGKLTTYDRFKAFCSTLPVITKKHDSSQKRFGKMLDTLVTDATDTYSRLNIKMGEYKSNFEDVDDLFDNLITDSKRYVTDMKTQDGLKNQYAAQLESLEEQLKGLNRTDANYLDIKKGIIEVKRNLEEASSLRSSALNQYNNALNLLDALDGLRDESVVMLSEGKKLYESLQASVETLTPLFDQVSSAADFAEFQVKALEAHDMLKDTFNPAMIAITAVAKGVSKVATERLGENFIEDKTISAVRALTTEHQQEREKRLAIEDQNIEDILKQNPTLTGEDIVNLEEDEKGTYFVEDEKDKE